MNSVNFSDPIREIKRLQKVIKKQGNEIARDMSKIEAFTHHLQNELNSNNKAFDKITGRLNRLEQDIRYENKLPHFENCDTFRDYKENVHTNIADEVSKYSSSQRRDHGVDRADLLIMCNKIKEDVKKSLQDTLHSKKYSATSFRTESQPVTKRDHKNVVQTSIEKYRTAYGSGKKIRSPVKRIRYNSRITSARHVAFNSETSRSGGKTLDPKASFDNTYQPVNLKINQSRTRQEKDGIKTTKLASFSPFSTIKSREKEARAHQKRLKSKKALSKLDKIYQDLQTMEKEFKGPLHEL